MIYKSDLLKCGTCDFEYARKDIIESNKEIFHNGALYAYQTIEISILQRNTLNMHTDALLDSAINVLEKSLDKA